MDKELNVLPKDFKDRIMLHVLCTTTSFGAEKTMTNCKRNSAVVAENAKDFPKDTVHSLDLDLKKNGMLRSLINQMVYGTK